MWFRNESDTRELNRQKGEDPSKDKMSLSGKVPQVRKEHEKEKCRETAPTEQEEKDIVLLLKPVGGILFERALAPTGLGKARRCIRRHTRTRGSTCSHFLLLHLKHEQFRDCLPLEI